MSRRRAWMTRLIHRNRIPLARTLSRAHCGRLLPCSRIIIPMWRLLRGLSPSSLPSKRIVWRIFWIIHIRACCRRSWGRRISRSRGFLSWNIIYLSGFSRIVDSRKMVVLIRRLGVLSGTYGSLHNAIYYLSGFGHLDITSTLQIFKSKQTILILILSNVSEAKSPFPFSNKTHSSYHLSYLRTQKLFPEN